MGSLIKNPGGGLAPTGGYIAGKETLIQLISYRLTSPGNRGAKWGRMPILISISIRAFSWLRM